MSTALPLAEVHGAYRGARVLVLGASGFVGRWVAHELSRAGAELVLAVRDPAAAAADLARLGVRGELRAVDLEPPGSVLALVRAVRPAVVFDLAGHGVDPGERAPTHENETRGRRLNAELVHELAEALIARREPEWPFRALVHAGSALELGRAGGDLAEDGPARPTTTYGIAKLAGTRALARSAAASGLPALTARLFTLYGPGEHAGRLLPSLLAARGSDEPLALTAGTQRRDFTFVADAAEGLLRLGLSSGEPGEVVNLATGVLRSVREFAERAARVLGLDPARLDFGALPTRAGEQVHEPVTTARLVARTGWRPATTIEEGVRRTLAAGAPA